MDDTAVRQNFDDYHFGNTFDISKDFIREMKYDKEFTNMVCNRYLRIGARNDDQKIFMKQIANYFDQNTAIKNLNEIAYAGRKNPGLKAAACNLGTAINYIKSLK